MLSKEETLFERNDNGDLLPIVKPLMGNKDKEIKFVPLNRGQVLSYLKKVDKDGNTTEDQDREIVLKQCLEPKFTEEELKFAKHAFIQSISLTIWRYSGMVMKESESDALGESLAVEKKNEEEV